MNKKYSLDKICSDFLDNADMIIDFSKLPEINFIFHIAGTIDNKYWKIVFTCNNLIKLTAENHDLLEVIRDEHLILSVKIKSIPIADVFKNMEQGDFQKYKHLKNEKDVHVITLDGGTFFEIQCIDFSWRQEELTEEEHINR